MPLSLSRSLGLEITGKIHRVRYLCMDCIDCIDCQVSHTIPYRPGPAANTVRNRPGQSLPSQPISGNNADRPLFPPQIFCNWKESSLLCKSSPWTITALLRSTHYCEYDHRIE